MGGTGGLGGDPAAIECMGVYNGRPRKMGWIHFHLGSVSRTPLNVGEAQMILRGQNMTPQAEKKHKEDAPSEESSMGHAVSCKIQQLFRDNQPRAVYNAETSRDRAEQEINAYNVRGP